MRKSRVLGLVVGMTGALTGVACAGESAIEAPGPQRQYDDQPVLVGQFTGFVDETGMHISLVPSVEIQQVAQERGVAVEDLTLLTNGTGSGRGLNPASTYEMITCSASTLPNPSSDPKGGCVHQYGQGVIINGLYTGASSPAACGTIPGGRSGTCYAADVEIREFQGVDISNVYLMFNGTGSVAGANIVLPYDGTPATLGVPTSLNNTTYRYGTLETGPTGAQNLDSPYHQASVHRWRFSYPAGTTDFNFTFTGNVYATIGTGNAPHQASVTTAGDPTSAASVSGCISDNGDYQVGTALETSTGLPQVWLHRRRTGETQWVSRNSAGALGTGGSVANPCISPDGSIVVYESTHTNLAATDTNSVSDIFARVISAGTTNHVSRNSAGAGGMNCGTNGSVFPSVSADGRYVAFVSACGSFCSGAGCANNRFQVYRRDLATATLAGVSQPNGVTTAYSDAPAQFASISGDGNLITFQSVGTTLTSDPDGGGVIDVFVRNMTTSSTVRITNDVGNGYRIPQISRSGSHVVFVSTSNTFVSGFTDTTDLDVFRCTATAPITCTYASIASGTISGNGASGSNTLVGASISPDGNLVAFQSLSANLVGGDTNGVSDIFVRNMTTGVTSRVSVNSVGTQGDAASIRPRISTNASGSSYVSYTSDASNLLFDSAGSFDSDGGASDVFSVRL